MKQSTEMSHVLLASSERVSQIQNVDKFLIVHGSAVLTYYYYYEQQPMFCGLSRLVGRV